MLKNNIIERVESERLFLEKCLKKLIADIGRIPIANTTIMPLGWRKAAKGRTVWRILEEVIGQNLETKASDYGFDDVSVSDSEVSVWDFRFKIPSGSMSYVNIKSSVKNGKKNKDDISKAEGLNEFYASYPDANLYVATFIISFQDDMTIEVEDVIVFPVAWIPDIYINPSNNGNLQSSKYKDLSNAIRRTNEEFFAEFQNAWDIAKEKKKKKEQS